MRERNSGQVPRPEDRFTDLKPDPEADWEDQSFFDGVVKREYDNHPELPSRRKKLIFVQETFGWEADRMQIAHFLGSTEEDTKRFLSRRGMRQEEYDALSQRFDAAFSVASIIARKVEGILLSRDAIVRPHSVLEQRGIKKLLQQGEGIKAVGLTERTLIFLDEHYGDQSQDGHLRSS